MAATETVNPVHAEGKGDDVDGGSRVSDAAKAKAAEAARKISELPWRVPYLKANEGDAGAVEAAIPPPETAYDKRMFDVPSPYATLRDGVLTYTKLLSTTLAYFVFTIVYTTRLAEVADGDLFLLQTFLISMTPLVQYLFLAYRRTEYSARKIIYYYLLRNNVVMDFDNFSPWTRPGMLFLVAINVYVVAVGTVSAPACRVCCQYWCISLPHTLPVMRTHARVAVV